MNKTGRTSWVWNYFQSLSDDLSMCSFCYKDIGRNGSSTSGMRRHLKTHGIFESQKKEIETDSDGDTDILETQKHNKFNTISSTSKVKAFSSWVWNYYEKLSGDKSECRICNKIIGRCGGTSALLAHLNKHGIAKSNDDSKDDTFQASEVVNNCSKLTKDFAGNKYSSKLLKTRGIFEPTKDNTDTDDSDDQILGSIKDIKNNSGCANSTIKQGYHRSWVWDYYKKATGDKVFCNVCSKLIPRAHGSTSGMIKHLKLHEIFPPTQGIKDDKKSKTSEPEEFSINFVKSIDEKKNSWVWNYFQKLSDGKCFCNVCNKNLCKTNVSTTDMQKHLKMHNIFESDKHELEVSASCSQVDATAMKNCYVCDAMLGLDRYQLITLAGFTETPIHGMIEFFVGTKLTEQQRKYLSVCVECFVSLDKYDELQHQAREIQTKLTSLFQAKYRSETIYIKQEPSLDYEEQSYPGFSDMEVDAESKEFQKGVFMFKNMNTSNDSECSENPSIDIKEKKQDQETDIQKKGFFNCKHCGITFTHKKEFLQHSKTHIPDKKFRCEQCTNTYTNDRLLQIHLTADHGPSDGPFDCQICFKSCKNRQAFRQHCYVHKTDSSFLCFVCGATFVHKRSFRSHMFIHDDVRPFVCDVPGCTRKFRYAAKLKIHLRVHTGEKKYECSLCPGKRFAQKWGLDLHVKKQHKHEIVQTETCKICAIKISSKFKMKLHLSKVHQVAGIADEEMEEY